MRLLIASVAALAAVAFAAPSFAQEAAPPPAPAAKPKPGTSAYCNTLKTSASKSSCLKRVHASAKSSHKAKAKKADPAKTDTSAQYTPPPQATPAPATPAQAPSTSQTVAIPPLPQKTI